jgi:hypothetical protein
MAFTPEGAPLELLNGQCWARGPEEVGKKAALNSQDEWRVLSAWATGRMAETTPSAKQAMQ